MGAAQGPGSQAARRGPDVHRLTRPDRQPAETQLGHRGPELGLRSAVTTESGGSVGGPIGLIDRILADEQLEALPAEAGDAVDHTGALLREITERYLPPDQVPGYIEFAATQLGEQIAIYLRPERWLTADLGPGVLPPGVT